MPPPQRDMEISNGDVFAVGTFPDSLERERDFGPMYIICSSTSTVQ
jgi:hypothetical protein